MPITPETWKLINGEESIDVEWKESVPTDLDEAVVSFSNAGGGVILIGVEEYKDKHGRQRGRLVKGKGARIDQKTEEKIKNVIEGCEEKLEYEVIKEEETPGYGVFVIKVSEGKNKPYCTPGGTYKIRISGRKRPIHPAQMREIIHKKAKGEIRLVLITPDGTTNFYKYRVFWDIYDEDEQEDIKIKYPGKWEIKTLDTRKKKIDRYRHLFTREYEISPEIKLGILNKGPANADKVHGFIDFPQGIKISESKRHQNGLTKPETWLTVKNNTLKCFVDNIPPTLLFELSKFHIKFPRENKVYRVYYKNVAGEIISEGHVDIEITNYFRLLKEIN